LLARSEGKKSDCLALHGRVRWKESSHGTGERRGVGEERRLIKGRRSREG
jgi:hypothetical protein